MDETNEIPGEQPIPGSEPFSVSRDSTFSTAVLNSVSHFLEQLADQLDSKTLKSAVEALDIVSTGNAPVIKQDTFYTSRYPVVSVEMSQKILSNPRRYIVVINCPEHGEEFTARAWGRNINMAALEFLGFGHDLASTERLLDTLRSESDVEDLTGQVNGHFQRLFIEQQRSAMLARAGERQGDPDDWSNRN